ncbi:GAF domain-containing sensor histidine kinase [Anaerolineales bacterium HSG6]|nr:GAF domain-containing sensor histidine kinase [Anaerolineales bacterium HSG6]
MKKFLIGFILGATVTVINNLLRQKLSPLPTSQVTGLSYPEQPHLSETLLEVTKIVSSTLKSQEVIDLILNQLEKVVQYHHATVTLLGNDELSFVAGRDEHGKVVKNFTMPVDHYPLNAAVLESHRPILIPDVNLDTRWQPIPNENPPTRSFINAPLVFKNRPIGLLGIRRYDQIQYTPKDAETIFAFATQVAIALENARLAEKTETALLENQRLYQISRQELLDRERAEAALQVANEELTRLNVNKDKFFSIVAHDLRGPFAPLINYSDLLVDIADTAPAKEIMEISEAIHSSAKVVYKLLDNLLEWSRLQMGQMSYHPTKIDLTAVVQQNLYLVERVAAQKNVVVQAQLPQQFCLNADEDMFDTVLRNLISNALKFTPADGQVTIFAQPYNGNKSPSNAIEIAVCDTGVGMSKTDVNKLFKIETHHTTLGTNDERGTGLGLMICQEMVNYNHGKIWVESIEEEGTTVRFTVPRWSD